MNQQSDLQRQYPLSPKKFWKKLIEKLSIIYIFGIMAAIFDLVIIFVNKSSSDSSGVTAVLWGILVAGFIFLIVVTFLYAWYVKVYIRRYYYDGEEHFITIKKGVFAPTEIHVQWQKIQDVYVDQDILDRIMGLYDVHIASATASSGIEAHIDGVDEAAAEGLKKFLLGKVAGSGVQGSNINQPQHSQPKTTKINLREDVSSRTYPLSNKWTVVTLLSRLIGSFGFTGFILFFMFLRSDGLITLNNWVYFVLGWLALGILTMIVRIITFFLWKKNYAFDLTPENIYYKEGVISLSEKHMPYSSVQNVTVRQGVIERLFGLAKVVIENAAQQSMAIGNRGQQAIGFGGVVLQGLSLADANKINEVLKTIVLGKEISHHGL